MSTQLRNIKLHARPAKYAILVSSDIENWEKNALRILDGLSLFWGGYNAAIIPVYDGKIPKPFGFVIDKYEPDYVKEYTPRMQDVEHVLTKDQMSKLRRDIRDDIQNGSGNYGEEQLERLVDQAIESGVGTLTDPIQVSSEFDYQMRTLNPFASFPGNNKLHNFNASSPPRASIPINQILNSYDDDSLKVEGVNHVSSTKTEELFVDSYIGRKDAVKKFWNDIGSGPLGSPIGHKLELEYTETLPNQFNLFEKARFKPKPPTIFGYNAESLVRLESPRQNLEQDIIVFSGNSLQDFCAYFSLSSIYPRVFWVPQPLIGNAGGCSVRGFLREISRFEEQNTRSVDCDFLVTSLTMSNKELSEYKSLFEERLKPDSTDVKAIENPDLPSLFGKNPQKPVERDSIGNSYIEQFHGGLSASRLKTPVPNFVDPKISAASDPSISWIVDVILEEGVNRSQDKRKYILPKHPASIKNSFLNVNRHRDDLSTKFRATTNGFSYEVLPNGLIRSAEKLDEVIMRPQVKVKQDFDIVKDLFEYEDYGVEIWDKGEYTQKSLQLAGGLQGLSHILTDKHEYQVIDKYMETDKSHDGDNEIVSLSSTGRVYMTLSAMSKFFGNDKQKTLKFLDKNLERGIFRRGHVLRCSHCRNVEWYSVSEVNNEFLCGRCGTSQQIRKESWNSDALNYKDLPFYYELAEVFYQGMDNNMRVPVLTADYLRRNSEEKFCYIPEIGIYKDGKSPQKDKKPDREIDFACVSDGRLFLGEAKSNPGKPIPDDVLSDYNDFAKKLMGTFVFSTSEEWSEEKRQVISDSFDESEVKFLDSNCEDFSNLFV